MLTQHAFQLEHKTGPWITYHHFMRKMGAAVIIARWWRAIIGPYLYLWHWQGVSSRAATMIQVRAGSYTHRPAWLITCLSL